VTDGFTLALDASTYAGSVAVLRGTRVLAERSVAMRGETEERLMPAVLDALRHANAATGDLARVVCGEGPGSFTSLRIAASIAKGVAFARGIPLFAVSSLALVVAGSDTLEPGDYLAVLDAMRGERYVALCRRGAGGSVTRLEGSRLIPSDEVESVAAAARARAVGPTETPATPPHARGVMRMLDAVLGAGAVSLDAWEPSYGRLAEAQVKWEAAHGRPLTAS
jgi:tRNA threonylcarbamoyladenosine biosynthesis protein TsaB